MVRPVDQVLGGVRLELRAAPAREAVGGRVHVEGVAEPDDVRVGGEPRQDRTPHDQRLDRPGAFVARGAGHLVGERLGEVPRGAGGRAHGRAVGEGELRGERGEFGALGQREGDLAVGVVDDGVDLQRGVGGRTDARGVPAEVEDLAGRQRAVVDPEVADPALEEFVAGVERLADVVGRGDAGPDGSGGEGDRRVAGLLHAVLVQDARVAGLGVGDVLPDRALQSRGGPGVLLGGRVPGGDGGPERVAGGEQVPVAGAAARGVAETVEEVRRGLGGVDPHVHRDGDRVHAAHDVVRHLDVGVGAVERESFPRTRPAGGAVDGAVPAVARGVSRHGARGGVEFVPERQAVGDLRRLGGGRRAEDARQERGEGYGDQSARPESPAALRSDVTHGFTSPEEDMPEEGGARGGERCSDLVDHRDSAWVGCRRLPRLRAGGRWGVA